MVLVRISRLFILLLLLPLLGIAVALVRALVVVTQPLAPLVALVLLNLRFPQLGVIGSTALVHSTSSSSAFA